MRGRIAAALAVWLVAAQAYAQPTDAAATDLSFGRAIAIMRADVATGDELAQRRDWGLAYRHFMFPVEEVYAIVREDLRTYKTPPFDSALKTLARTARGAAIKQYPVALNKVQGALDAAQADLRARQPNWPPFVVRVAVALLSDVPDEYEDAIEGGRMARPLSYQMARSFIREADRMIESVAAELETINPEALRDIRANLAPLKQAFEPLNAPIAPPIDLSVLIGRVKSVEAAAAKL